MSGAPLMLGVSGLRGIVGQSLTPEVTARYAAAVGSWLVERRSAHDESRRAKRRESPSVIIGSDGRAGGDMIVAAAAAGLTAAGCYVYTEAIVMTPTLGVLVDQLGAAAGLQVTASHNPQEWNGIKVLLRDEGVKRGDVLACAPSASVVGEILARFRAEQIAYRAWDSIGSSFGEVMVFSPADHVALVLKAISGVASPAAIGRHRFSVALDSVGGAGGSPGAAFFKELKCRAVLEGQYRAGRFSHAPEPTRDNLGDLCRLVRRKKVEIGFAQDPDADRLAIVDERGEYIGEEYTLALAAESLLGAPKAGTPKQRRRGDTVLVANLSTSRMLDDIAARYGARVVRTAVGEANVVEAMKREKAAGHRVVLGGEGNGGVIWPEVTYVRDSLSAMALVLALMARTGKKVSELVADIPAYAIEKRKVDLARKDDAAPAVEKIAAAYRDQKIDRQDGVRVDWTGRRAWLHVRASNTEPIMRLIAEAPTAAEARATLDEAARIIAG